MELKNYLTVLWRRKWIVLLTAVVALAVALAGTLMVTPKYEASTTLRVATATSGSLDQVRYDITYADRLMNTYSEMATSSPVVAELQQKLGIKEPPQIEVKILANTELMQITVEDQDPVMARDTANTLADILVARSRDAYTEGVKTARELLSEQLDQAKEELDQARRQYESLLKRLPGDSQRVTAAGRSVELKEQTYAMLLQRYEQARITEAIRADAVSVFEPAAVPETPSRPRKELNLALALLLGLVGGMGLVFLFENLDTTLYTTEQIEEAAELSTLGKIPWSQWKIAFFNSNSPQEEAFRHLRTNLFALNHGTPLQTLLVTSAEPSEGKSTVLANLALAIAQSGRKVVVVDGDLRVPTLHKIFDLSNEVGLSSVLQQKVTLDEAVQNTNTPKVQLLTSGPLPPNPAELLGSPQMAALIDQLVQRFDMVLLDSPALLAVTDAAVLAPVVDGVMLVVGRAQARQETVRAACQQLANNKARSIGVVVNRAELNGSYHYYHRTPARNGK